MASGDARLRWGILGPGRISVRLVRALDGNPRGVLAAVGSRDAARAEAFAAAHGSPRAHGSYEALLADDGVDAVYVALPNSLHAEWTIRALEAGKHVLCEKPLALSADDVDAIAAASARTGRIAVEAFMYLHHPQVLRALELARSGAIGPLELVDGAFSFFLTRPDDPRIDPVLGGGSLWDVGCYPVSFACRLAGGEPDRVAAYARFDDRGVDRTFVGQLHFPGGLLARFDSGFAAPERQRLEIVGGDARLVLDAPFLPTPDGPEPGIRVERTDGGTTLERFEPIDQYRAEVDDLAAAVLDGTAPRLSLAASRATIATLASLDRAARADAGLAPR